MKWIEVIQNFRHNGEQFHKGERRYVSAEDAGYFCGLGWATSEGLTTGEPDTSPKTLEMKSAQHRTKGETVNG